MKLSLYRNVVMAVLLMIPFAGHAALDEEAGKATAGYQDKTYRVTVSFPTEEAPEYFQGDGTKATFVVYLLAAEPRTAYQFSHLGRMDRKFEEIRRRYLGTFLKEAEKMGGVTEAETLTLIEDRANRYFSYITKTKANGGVTVALFSDFYVVEDHLYVVSQIKILSDAENESLDSGKNEEFFASVRVAKT